MMVLYTFIFFLVLNSFFGTPPAHSAVGTTISIVILGYEENSKHFYQDGIFIRTTAVSLFVRKTYAMSYIERVS